MTVEERFLAKAEKHDADCDCCAGCWFWTGAIDLKGYARFGLARKNRTAHRVSYELFVGPIPEGLSLDHLCRVRHCVNPAHLEPVTNAENLRRGLWPHNRYKQHCPQGHKLVLKRNGTRRHCPQCDRESARRYEQRQREAGRRGIANAAKTHCPRGHAYTPENTYAYEGHRQCKACRLEHTRRWNERRRAELSAR